MKKLVSYYLIHIFCSLSFYSDAQSEVYIFDMNETSDTIHIDNPRLLTMFDWGGSCSDPYLVNKEKLLLLCQSSNEKQSDIWSLDLQNNYYQQISDTKANETLINLHPSTNEYLFIQNSQDDLNGAKLCYYPLDQSHAGNSIMNFDHAVKSFITKSDDEILVLFDINPTQLAIANIESKKTTLISSKVGSTFQYINELIYFIHKTSPFTWYLKAYNIKLRQANTLFKLPIKTERFAHINDNKWLFANDAQLYILDLDQSSTWKQFENLEPYGILNITQLTVKSGKLIITTE